MIRDSFIEHLKELERTDGVAYKLARRGEPRLVHVSELGSCPLKPFLRLSGVPSADWIDDYLLELFFNGNLWEREILKSIAQYTPATQVVVRNDVFSGKIDALIGGHTSIIVEIKDTADHNFRARDRLPYLHHCYQVLAYEVLLQAKWGDIGRGPIECRLYYHGRSQWAEFVVKQEDWGISVVGNKNGDDVEVPFLGADVNQEMSLFRDHFENGTFPARYETPFTERFACTKTVKGYTWPACQYIEHCWPKLTNPPWDSDLWYDDVYHPEEMDG